MRLQSFIAGAWADGCGDGTPLTDPVTGTELARASSDGIDMAAALDYARLTGGPALRAMTFGERAAMLDRIAETLVGNRNKYFATAQANSGNTQIDAAIDIDGGSGTLKYYGHVGSKLGDAKHLKDGGFERLGKDEAFQAMHVLVPLQGVAVHINAFNFPSWGLWEKIAVAFLAGVPVLAKPATATALLSYEMVKDVVAADIVPAGALSLVCGGARDLVANVTRHDAIAFTGSAETAHRLRGDRTVIANAVRFNAEADSLNTSLLGPDATADSPEFDLFVREVVREMTVKAGQKCTAIRRVLVPADLAAATAEAIAARLGKTVVGDPRDESVRMGPVVNKTQQEDVRNGIKILQQEADVVVGDGTFRPVGADPEKGAFVPPTLLRCNDPAGANAVHEVEVFGPVATLMPYASPADAYALAARGGGSLVASVFTGDDTFATDAALALASSHGRILVVNEGIGKSSTGHGIVMPMCTHGGPGRAGGGEELGGLRGLRFYHQRAAVQASSARLATLAGKAADLAF